MIYCKRKSYNYFQIIDNLINDILIILLYIFVVRHNRLNKQTNYMNLIKTIHVNNSFYPFKLSSPFNKCT